MKTTGKKCCYLKCKVQFKPKCFLLDCVLACIKRRFKTPAYLHRGRPVRSDIHKGTQSSERLLSICFCLDSMFTHAERAKVGSAVTKSCTGLLLYCSHLICTASQQFVFSGRCTLKGRAADLFDLPAVTIQQACSRHSLSKLWQKSRASQSRRECLPLFISAVTASCAAVAKLATQSRRSPEMKRSVASCRASIFVFSPAATC